MVAPERVTNVMVPSLKQRHEELEALALGGSEGLFSKV